MVGITLSQAQSVVAGALEAARAAKSKPLAVVVIDAAATPIAVASEDGASMYRFDIARAKASGALGMGDSTRALAERAKGNPVFFGSVSGAVAGAIAFSPGGLVIRGEDCSLLGAIGISGDTGECDEAVALAGLRAAGFEGVGA